MIVAQDLHKTFVRGLAWWRKSVPVLNGFDFHARPGEVTGVLGPNGAGKTTFFRMISGLERPTSGSLLVDGIDPWQNPKYSRGHIALLPEDAGIPGDITGYHHLWIFGIMMGYSPEPLREALAVAGQDLSLESFWSRPAGTYSRGQKARISLARLKLMPQATTFIFDEPSNGLDFEAVARLHKFIRNLADEGKTVLVASHIISDLRHLCDRLVGIDGGKAATRDTLSSWLAAHDQVRARPQALPDA